MVTDTEDNGEQPNVDTSLADFEKDFYPQLKEKAPKPEPEAEAEEPEEEAEDSTESEEVEPLATEEEDTEEEEAEEEPKPEKKVSPTQKRINELTAKARQEEREKLEARKEIEALRREVETIKAGREKEEPKPLRSQLPDGAPDPDALNEDGSPVYVLGDIDRNYIADLTKFIYNEENKATKERERQKDWEEGVKAAQEELAGQWATKVEQVEEEIPTLRDDIAGLTETFESIGPDYGEYLAMTIMQCDNGPQIMHYFSQNIDEAQRIVASGPAAATLAIGRLEAKLAKLSPDAEETKQHKKVSQAPTPPEKGARGVNGRQSIRPDTPNLDDFGLLFYDKK